MDGKAKQRFQSVVGSMDRSTVSESCYGVVGISVFSLAIRITLGCIINLIRLDLNMEASVRILWSSYGFAIKILQ